MHLDYLSASGTKLRPCTVGQSCPNAPSGDKYYEFAYDGRGVRMIERLHTGSSLTTKHYTYAPDLSLLGYKAPGKNGAGIEAIWFAGAPVAQDAWGTHGQTKWTFTDHLGTPLLQTNSSKAVVWRAEYEPYGNVYAMRNGTKDDQPLRFPGQERLFDGSTGTEERYNVYRWYRSGWGRYTQPDPLGLRGDINLFGYVTDAPTAAIDPLGLQLYNPTYPRRSVPPGCSQSWRYVTHRIDSGSAQSLWRLVHSRPLEIGSEHPEGHGGVNCLCEYEIQGALRTYDRWEQFERTVTCCGNSASAKMWFHIERWKNLEPIIASHAEKHTVAPFDHSSNECLCPPSITEPIGR
ncbi:MAG: RHS repeat-associated core domain-containing protein [Thermoanaerobaculia bacterium]|jgi:RHS repeat-associated protein